MTNGRRFTGIVLSSEAILWQLHKTALLKRLFRISAMRNGQETGKSPAAGNFKTYRLRAFITRNYAYACFLRR
jgi:hypothetical protein